MSGEHTPIDPAPWTFIDDRHVLYCGWIMGIAAKHSVPLLPVRDDRGNYTPVLRLALNGVISVNVIVPYPPDDWEMK